MNSVLSDVSLSNVSLSASDGAVHWTLWPKRCKRMKHCISKSTSGSIEIRRPSKMPVRGGSRSRYSIAKPYFTIAEVALNHKLSSDPGGVRRCPTNSCPASCCSIETHFRGCYLSYRMIVNVLQAVYYKLGKIGTFSMLR